MKFAAEFFFEIIGYRERWPQQTPSFASQTLGVREAYLRRRSDLLQFKFSDPVVVDFITDTKPVDHILVDEEDIIYSKVYAMQHITVGSDLTMPTLSLSS